MVHYEKQELLSWCSFLWRIFKYFSWNLCGFVYQVPVFVACLVIIGLFRCLVWFYLFLVFFSPLKENLLYWLWKRSLWKPSCNACALKEEVSNSICADRKDNLNIALKTPEQLGSAVPLCLLTTSFWGCCRISVFLQWEGACVGSSYYLLLRNSVSIIKKSLLSLGWQSKTFNVFLLFKSFYCVSV